MKSVNRWRRVVAVAALLLLVGPGFAQLQTGNLYGTVADDRGAALSGVTVTLSGQGAADQVQVTDDQGKFRFLDLSPGSYELVAKLEGFASVTYPNIAISVGRNTEVEVTMESGTPDTPIDDK